MNSEIKNNIKVDIKAEVHFYENRNPANIEYLMLPTIRDNIAIVLENDSDENNKKLGELLLLCFYILRIGVNLDWSMSSFVFGHKLLTFIDKFSGWLPISIYKFENKKGKKRILISLVFNTISGKEKLKFTVKPKGFGFLNLSKDLITYSEASVFALCHYLLVERKKDLDYIKKLTKIVRYCARVLIDEKVNVVNQNNLALIIAFLCFFEENFEKT